MTERNVPVQSLIDHIKTAIDVDPWAKEMAEALLKEHEAVKPKCKERIGGFVAGICPTCGTALNNILNAKACGKCGQAVKWND